MKESNVVPDYDASPTKVYLQVMEAVNKDEKFANILSPLLGLSEKDIDLRGRCLYAAL